MLFFWIGFNFKRSNINQEEDQIREQDDEDVEGAPREKWENSQAEGNDSW